MTVIDMGGHRRRGARETPAPPRQRTRYEDVMDLVERLIVDNRLSPGDLLPTQTELAEQAGVSLISVRRGLDELERAGRVRRHQGVGTFVAHPKIVSQPTVSGGLGNTLVAPADRDRIATNVLSVRRVFPSADLADALGCLPSDELWQVRRQRLLSGQPIVLETALIPTALAPDLDRHPTERLSSLYELLAGEYGLQDAYEEQYLEVIAPAAADRKLLKLAARSQVVRIRGLSVDAAGTPFDCFEQMYPAAHFVFGMSGSTSRQLLRESASRKWEVRASSVEPGFEHPR
jgi:DNA-binding GntR family transcriptional regulator